MEHSPRRASAARPGWRPAATVALAVAAIWLLASCVSVADLDRRDAADIPALFNAGRADQLAARCSLPFAVDREIVALPGDTAAYLRALHAAGLRLHAPSGSDPAPRSEPVGPEDWRRFADSAEMRVFFQSTVAPGARFLAVPAEGGGVVLFVVGVRNGQPVIYGMRGPD